MATCPYCGGPVSDNANFCQRCGSDLRTAPSGGLYREEDPAEFNGYAESEEYAEPEEYIESEEYAEPEEYIESGEYAEPEEYADERKSAGRSRSYYETDELYRIDEDDDNQDHEAKKTLTVGIVLAGLICVLGIGLYFIVSNMLKQQPKIDVGTGLNNRPVQVTTVPEKEHSLQAEEKDEKGEGVPETQEEELDEIQATVSTLDPEQFPEYQRAGFVASQESSVLEDGGVYHVSGHMIDGNPVTSWQEGSEGDGVGEWVYVQMDRSYSVRYLTFMLGNWRSQSLYYANNRPSRLFLRLDEQEFYLDFPDEMRTFTVELSKECQASEILIQVLDVYDGANWSDCCISEMSIYGR